MTFCSAARQAKLSTRTEYQCYININVLKTLILHMLFCIIIYTLLLLFRFGVSLHVLFFADKISQTSSEPNSIFVLGSLLISLILAFFLAQNREPVILATEAFSVRKERALQKVYSEMTNPKHTNISGWSSLSSCILSILSAQYLHK